ncbi:elongin A, like isoform X3 [Stegostoma tigrinum]|uniref:elongin A, like isoform X3 n=1 Tax=Stegostoma tigrinum TaxID=3053191 RepID=UPI0028706A69|nr:elongin A, like isoform X3 [Stegostoma tigrinum]
MAEEIVQKVLHLKERLLGVSDSNKILKLLKKLQDLNITVDILVETGIGKTVNGFRKDDAVGDLAKELVCQWKKLIPQEIPRNSTEQNEKKRNNDDSSFRRKDTKKNTNKSSGPSRQEEILHETDVNESVKLLSQEGNPKKKERSASNQYPKINPYQLKSNECQPSRMDSKECCHGASKNNFLHHQQSLKFQKPVKSKPLPKDESNFSRKDKKSTDVLQKKKYNEDQYEKESSIESSSTSSNGKIDINTLLDIPLPKFLPDVTDMTSVSPPTSPIKKSAMSNISDSTVEFTGRRLNCKMQVYSGSKTTNIMKMMSLYEQCIRVLQNNIDSIHEVGGVPFEILEPVLGRCTPEQLFRIEECNPSFIEQSSHFWMKHCKKDFKNEEPQEYESWRELYLRLHDEREEKLKILTQSISSAHANKPKGRQVKLAYVNTSAKPPRDILRQQGKHRKSCSALLNSPFGKNKKKFVAGTECSSFAGGSACSDRPKANSGCVAPNSYSGPDAKRQVKKVAPMMAKSLRAFKNRLGPR